MIDTQALDHNKAQVRMIVEEVFNRGSLEVAVEIFAADFVDWGHEQVAGKKDGPGGFAQFLTSSLRVITSRCGIQGRGAERTEVARGVAAMESQRQRL